MRFVMAAFSAFVTSLLLAHGAIAQAPPVTITCGNPGVMCGTVTAPIVTTPSSGGPLPAGNNAPEWVRQAE